MRRLRKIAVASLVWATAGTMLMASTPHVICRCPNGQIKYFCFGSAAEKASCCCKSKSGSTEAKASCCTAAKAKGKPSCCQGNPQGSTSVKERKSNLRLSNGNPSLAQTCCQKTLVQVKGPTLTPPDAKPNQVTSEAFHVCWELGTSYLAFESLALKWGMYELPPPTDLVTSLHRLTI